MKKGFSGISIKQQSEQGATNEPGSSEQDSVPLIKKCIIHVAFLLLMVGIAWQGKITAVTDRNSLLYNIIAGEEIIEGPLDPSAYASTDAPGVGGARLAVIDANIGIELITFDDPEVNFASTLGGNAVVAPLSPPCPRARQPSFDQSGKQSTARIHYPGRRHHRQHCCPVQYQYQHCTLGQRALKQGYN